MWINVPVERLVLVFGALAVIRAEAMCPQVLSVSQRTYESYVSVGSDRNSYIQRYTPEYGLSDQPSSLKLEGGVRHVVIAELCNGTFVVVWQPETFGKFPENLMGRLFSEQQYLSEPLRITSSNEQQWEHHLAPMADGGFVVTWKTWLAGPGTGQPIKIRARLFSSAGKPRGRAIDVSSSRGSHGQARPYGLPSGGFVVIWNTHLVGTRLRIFDVKGVPSADEIPVIANQDWPTVPYGTVTEDGRINVFVRFTRLDIPPSGPFAFGRSFDAAGTSLSPVLTPPAIESLAGYRDSTELLVKEVAAQLEYLVRATGKEISVGSICRHEYTGAFANAYKWKLISNDLRMKRFFSAACSKRLASCRVNPPEMKQSKDFLRDQIQRCADG